MVTELRTFTFIDDGKADLNVLVENIETVRDAIDELERLRSGTDTVEDIYPANAILAIESYGDHQILAKGIRSEMKISQVFIVAGGVSASDIQIEIFKNGDESLLDKPIVLKSTENTGKLKIGDVLDFKTISQFDTITVKTNSNRKIVVTMNFGEVD